MPDSKCHSLFLANRLRTLHRCRPNLFPVHPVDKGEQLGIVQPHCCRRDPGPAKLLLLERFRKQANTAPSHQTIFTRSARFERKTYSAPLNGSTPPSRTRAISDTGPLRKSTGVLAT